MYASVEPSPRTRKMPEEHPRKPRTPGRLSRMAVTTETVMALSRWADEIGLYRAIHRSTHSPKTIEGRLPSLRHAARYFEALGIAPQDVTRDHLMAYFDIEDERRRGAGPVVHRCNLRYFFAWLAREYDIPSPMARLRRPKIKHTDAPHVFTAAERKAILGARASRSYWTCETPPSSGCWVPQGCGGPNCWPCGVGISTAVTRPRCGAARAARAGWWPSTPRPR